MMFNSYVKEIENINVDIDSDVVYLMKELEKREGECYLIGNTPFLLLKNEYVDQWEIIVRFIPISSVKEILKDKIEIVYSNFNSNSITCLYNSKFICFSNPKRKSFMRSDSFIFDVNGSVEKHIETYPFSIQRVYIDTKGNVMNLNSSSYKDIKSNTCSIDGEFNVSDCFGIIGRFITFSPEDKFKIESKIMNISSRDLWENIYKISLKKPEYIPNIIQFIYEETKIGNSVFGKDFDPYKIVSKSEDMLYISLFLNGGEPFKSDFLNDVRNLSNSETPWEFFQKYQSHITNLITFFNNNKKEHILTILKKFKEVPILKDDIRCTDEDLLDWDITESELPKVWVFLRKMFWYNNLLNTRKDIKDCLIQNGFIKQNIKEETVMGSKRTITCGILPFKRENEQIYVFLGHPTKSITSEDDDFWSILKGRSDKDESPFDTAIREFNEESGITLSKNKTFISLGENKFPNKIFKMWAIEYPDLNPFTCFSNEIEIEYPPNSGNTKLIPEIDKYKWFSLEEAESVISPKQLVFIHRIKERI